MRSGAFFDDRGIGRPSIRSQPTQRTFTSFASSPASLASTRKGQTPVAKTTMIAQLNNLVVKEKHVTTVLRLTKTFGSCCPFSHSELFPSDLPYNLEDDVGSFWDTPHFCFFLPPEYEVRPPTCPLYSLHRYFLLPPPTHARRRSCLVIV
jgi:hypothetical protein